MVRKSNLDLEYEKFEQWSDYSVRTIETDHARIHEGVSFSTGAIFSGVADNADSEILFQVGNTSHTIFSISCSGDAEIHLFEGTTFSAAGTAMSIMNKNRLSSITSGNTATHTPTLSTDGTELTPVFVAGGHGGNAGGGSSSGFSREIILASGQNYLMRITNRGGAGAYVSAVVEWYEPSAT